MPRFMVESSHEREDPSEPLPGACLRALEGAVSQGSHYLTHAEFGCEDGVHKAWVFVDAEDKEDARRMVPPIGRATAIIVRVRQITPEEIRKLHAPGTN